MPRSHTEVEVLLHQLESALQEAELWALEPPQLEALQSSAPFACDRLAFEQWLQFVFIPNMRQCLVRDLALPHKMGLLPMGEQQFITSKTRETVLPILAKFDSLFKE